MTRRLSRRGFFGACATVVGAMLIPPAKVLSVEQPVRQVLGPWISAETWVKIDEHVVCLVRYHIRQIVANDGVANISASRRP